MIVVADLFNRNRWLLPRPGVRQHPRCARRCFPGRKVCRPIRTAPSRQQVAADLDTGGCSVGRFGRPDADQPAAAGLRATAQRVGCPGRGSSTTRCVERVPSMTTPATSARQAPRPPSPGWHASATRQRPGCSSPAFRANTSVTQTPGAASGQFSRSSQIASVSVLGQREVLDPPWGERTAIVHSQPISRKPFLVDLTRPEFC